MSYDFQLREGILTLAPDTPPVAMAGVVALFEALDRRALRVVVMSGADVVSAFQREPLLPTLTWVAADAVAATRH